MFNPCTTDWVVLLSDMQDLQNYRAEEAGFPLCDLFLHTLIKPTCAPHWLIAVELALRSCIFSYITVSPYVRLEGNACCIPLIVRWRWSNWRKQRISSPTSGSWVFCNAPGLFNFTLVSYTACNKLDCSRILCIAIDPKWLWCLLWCPSEVLCAKHICSICKDFAYVLAFPAKHWFSS